MSETIDPHTGDILTSGGGVAVGNLTPAQRHLAVYRDDYAISILAALDKGETWFTSYSLSAMKPALDELAEAGVLTKHESTQHAGRHYYKPTAICRNWCHTAIALRKERCRLLAERAGGSTQPG